MFRRSPFTPHRGKEPMRRISVALVSLVTVASAAIAQDAAKGVAGGGITLAGWQGSLDKGETMKLSDSKLEAFITSRVSFTQSA